MQRISIVTLFLIFYFSIATFAQSDAEENCSSPLDKKNKKKYEEAVELYNKVKYSECLKLLKEVQEAENEYADPYFLAGMIAIKRENINSAEKNFKQALELCPDYPNPYLYYYLGLINYSNEKFSEATNYYEKFFKLAEELNSPDFEKLYEEAHLYHQWSEFLGKVYANQVPFNPQPVRGISTPNDETFAYFSVDNTMVFFNRKMEEKEEDSFYEADTDTKNRLCMGEIGPDGIWQEGKPLPRPFNIFPDEAFATLTSDNKLLYYTVCNYHNTYFNCDIFYSEFKNGAWTPIQNAGKNINTNSTWDAQPSITPDGKWLYFSSDRPGGFGGVDIWRVKRLPSGDWGRPENLGTNVNTPGNEKTPFIHPDGVTLYFSSNGWKGVGGYDVFYTKIGNKSHPINLGYPINTEEDEVGFSISPDGSKGYFCSNKYKNTRDLDILEFDLYEKARPEPITLIKGTLTNESGEGTIGNIFFLKNITEEDPSEFKTDEETGRFTAVVKSNSDYLMLAKKEGYAYDYRLVTKNMLEGKNSINIDLQIRPIEIGGAYQLRDINFTTNSYELSKEDQFVIDAFVDFLRENPTVYVVIQGHTDNVGDSKENLKLSEARAKAVYDYLILKRIRQERLEYKGYGSSQPVASNDTEEGRSKNRRTVFVITRK